MQNGTESKGLKFREFTCFCVLYSEICFSVVKLPKDAVTMKHYLGHDELLLIIIFRKIYDKKFEKKLFILCFFHE